MSVTILASRYNNLRNQVNLILGDSSDSSPTFGYGQSFSTNSVIGSRSVANVINADKVSAQDYEDLYIDLIRTRSHQVGSAVTINEFVIGDYETNTATADKIEEAYILGLESLATNIITDKFTVHPDNLTVTNNPSASSTRSFATSGTWNGVLTHIFTMTFPSIVDRRHFFNAGGQIRLGASVDYTGSDGKTVDWQSILNAMGTISFKADETINNAGVGTGSSIGNYNLTSTYQLIYSRTGGAVYANNRYNVYAAESATIGGTSAIIFKVEFDDGRPNNTTFGIDEPVRGSFNSTVSVARPDSQVIINSTTHPAVVIPRDPVGSNVRSLASTTPLPTYSVAPIASSVNEGSSLTFNVSGTNITNGTYYWTIDTNAVDFGTSSGSFTITSNVGSFSVTPTADATTEGSEPFTVVIRSTGITGTILATSTEVIIIDTSLTPPPTPTYTLTPATSSVNEGSSLTITVGGTNITNGTYYWTIATNSGDFATTNGSVVVTSNVGSFSVTPTADATTEGAETFTVALRSGSVSGTVLTTSTSITINDTSTTPVVVPPPTPTYTITPSTTSVNEGNSVTFTVNTTNVANGTTLFWAVSDPAETNTGDFTDNISRGSFIVNNNVGTIVRGITADSFTEGTERFSIAIRTGSTSGPTVATSDLVTINDTSTTPVVVPPTPNLGGSISSYASSITLASSTRPFSVLGNYGNGTRVVQFTRSDSAGGTANYEILFDGVLMDAFARSSYLYLAGSAASSGTITNGASVAIQFTSGSRLSDHTVQVRLTKSGANTHTSTYTLPNSFSGATPVYTWGQWAADRGFSTAVRNMAENTIGPIYNQGSWGTRYNIAGTLRYGLNRLPDDGGISYWAQQGAAAGWSTQTAAENVITAAIGSGGRDSSAAISGNQTWVSGTGSGPIGGLGTI